MSHQRKVSSTQAALLYRAPLPSSAVQLHEMNFPLGQGSCLLSGKSCVNSQERQIRSQDSEETETTVGHGMRPGFKVPGEMSIVVVHLWGVHWRQNQLGKLPLIKTV